MKRLAMLRLQNGFTFDGFGGNEKGTKWIDSGIGI
jgi:hypothetical protein